MDAGSSEAGKAISPTVAPFDFGDYVEHASFIGGQPVFALADGSLRLLTSEGEKHVQAHDGLTCAAASIDGKALYTGGEDGRICLIDAHGAVEELASIGSKWVGAIAAGPSGTVGWTAGRNAYVYNKRETREFAHERTAEDIAFAPKGLRIAVARYNGADLHWAGTSSPKQGMEWDGAHTLIRFSPDGKYLVTSMQENSLHGWRLEDGRDMRMSGYPTKVKCMDFSAFTAKGGKWLATSGANSAVVWPFTGKEGPMGKMPRELGQRGDAIVTRVACHPSEEVVAIGYNDGMVLAVTIEDSREALLRRPGKGAISTLNWDKKGLQLIFGAESGEAGLIDLTG